MKIVLVIFTIVFSTSSFADGGLRFLEKNLEIINNETVLQYFRNIRATDVTYNPNRSSILARCVVIIDFSQN